ncbi:MAG TPA: flagellar basal body P-ring formation chaperone FlgA [Paucimonas sp.]|nr:flagellar basal body P-ring formation chaperone FlgA [Paucimonas sp.]
MNRFADIAVALLASASVAAGAQETVARQDPAHIRQVVEQFLNMQTVGLPGQVTIKIGQIDSRSKLAACAAPQAFLPGGSRAWGKTTVGVRCSEPATWTIYVPATVHVVSEYVVTAKPVAQGQSLSESDLAKIRGDLTTLPSGIVTDAAQAVGRSPAVSLPAGMPLRMDTLRGQQAVQQGQTVKLVSSGPGFRVSGEARALNNAMEGQVAQARTTSGQVISGIAKAGGVVEVTY